MKYLMILFFLLTTITGYTQPAALKPYRQQLDKGLKNWLHSYHSLYWNDFKYSHAGSFQGSVEKDCGIAEYKDIAYLQQALRIYSPSGNRVIDLYNDMGLEKRGDTVFYIGGDVDQTSVWYDVKQQTCHWFFFCGSSSRAEEAVWITENKLVLVGDSFEEDGQMTVWLLLGDIATGKYKFYKSKKAVKARSNYREERMKQLGVVIE